MHQPDICIAGAGIIGLSLALELYRRGAQVTVLEQGQPLAEASTAAAGMLAATDPDNPPQLRAIADLSLSLYPSFLDCIQSLSGITVPFHTSTTLQELSPHSASFREQDALPPETLSLLVPQLSPGKHRFFLIPEQSLDPRELAAAVLAAVRNTSIDLRPNTQIHRIQSTGKKIDVHIAEGVVSPRRLVDCAGAWSLTSHLLPHLQVTPRKGQMLSAVLPPSLPLHLVIRTPKIYIVPRSPSSGAQRAIIGATVEDAGFDKSVHTKDISHLHSLAAALLPPLANAPAVETWSGLRSAAQDGLPILGLVPDHPNLYIATGHYRNGILLAPATAHVMARILAGEPHSIDLSPFSPGRKPQRLI